MKKKITLLFLLLTFSLNIAQIKILTGLEVLKQSHFRILKGKRVGLITNPTGVDNNLISTVDIFFNAPEVNLVALFAPEHGVRGSHSAGEYVPFYTDTITGLPVYSLYGKTRKPTEKMLKNVDVLVYDIQDIGSRSYTYISTMGLSMEAAAENNKEFVLLDRPNPLGGNIVEGNLVEKGFFSFVSRFKIPYVYGLTAGELAKYLNATELKSKGLHCNLKIIKMKGWKRKMIFKDTGLFWVPTSPHIPEKNTPFYYAMTGIIGELGTISIGVGYTLPFKTIAAEWIDAEEFARQMNKLKLPGLLFRPISYKPYYSFGKGKTLHGVQIYIKNPYKIELTTVQFKALEVLHKLYPEKDLFKMADSLRIKMFDKVVGTDRVRKIFLENYDSQKLEKLFKKEAEKFKKESQKFYIYR